MSRGPKKPQRTRLSMITLESRLTPATDLGLYAVGVESGTSGEAIVKNADGSMLFQVSPYGADFTGGVRVAMADVTGDGTADLITAPGSGIAATIKVFDGVTQQEVASFDAYESTFTGGVSIAAADLNVDGQAEILTGADLGGGPRVRVFDGASVTSGGEPTTLADFLAIDDENFRGGVRIATGDVNGDDVADLVVGAGYGGGPRVSVYDGASLGNGEQVKLIDDFYAFEKSLRNGINVCVGDVNSDGKGDLIFGGGPGGSPRVRVADGAKVLTFGGGGSLDEMGDVQIANYFAGDPNSRDGVRVGTSQSDDGTVQVVGLDVETEALQVFGIDGQSVRSLSGTSGGKAGFFAFPPFDKLGFSKGEPEESTGGDTSTPGLPIDKLPFDDSKSPPPGQPIGGGDKTHGTPPTPPSSGGSDDTTTSPATQFFVTTQLGATEDEPVRITITALDASNRPARDYTGTIRLSSSDADATLPEDYTFTERDHGSHTFTFTPSIAGEQTIIATDTTTDTITGSVVVTVSEAPVATQFAVETKRFTESGASVQVLVVALDENDRPVKNYAGTVPLTSSDEDAVLPGEYTFTSADRGVHVFTVAWNTTGEQTLTATDTVTETIVGSITVKVRA